MDVRISLFDLIIIESDHKNLRPLFGVMSWNNGVCVWYVLLCSHRKWQDYVYIQCEYKSTKQKIKHLLREENKVKENKI